MNPPELIDANWIAAHGVGRREMHARGAGFSQWHGRVLDRRTGLPIGLRYVDTTYRPGKRHGTRAGTTQRAWLVDGITGACSSLDEALELLELIRDGDHRARVTRLHGRLSAAEADTIASAA
jgi:hypothetical protein